MKKVVIFGATSAIAHASARIWAAQGATLSLCVRDAQRGAVLAQDLMARGALQVHLVAFEADSVASCASASAAALADGCDIAVIAHGSLTDQPVCQRDATALAQAMQINFVSYAIIAEACAAHFEACRTGTLVVISSVAGDRGRASNYLYGAAKAGATALASGLRGRLAKVGAHVVTVKPGLVDTPMTAHLKKGPLFVGADVVGRGIVAAVERGSCVVYTPWFWRIIMGILAHVPERLFHKLPL